MVCQARRVHGAVAMAVAFGVYLLVNAATANSSEGAAISADRGPQEVLKLYLGAVYARDYKEAYGLISSGDRQWKTEKEYLRENESFTGVALTLARKLASFIQYRDVVTDVNDGRATVTFKVRLPDANDPALRQLLLDFEPDPLARLSDTQLGDLIARLDAMHRAGELPMIEGEEHWQLIKEPHGWHMLLNWAGAVRVRFEAEVKDNLPWKFWPAQEVVLAKPGETLQAVYRARNLSDKPVTAKAIHIDQPKDLADKYLEIIQCFCFIQQTLDPGEEKEFPLLFRIRWDAPETAKTFAVRYEFYPIESFPGQGPDREARQLAALDRGQLEVRLKDHREAITDFSRLELDIAQIGIQRGSRPQAGAWMVFAPSKRQVGLTRLVEGRYAIILKEEAPIGEYRWIRINLEKVEGVLRDGRRPSIKVLDDPVAITFLIAPGKRTVVTVDLVVLDVSEHPGQDHELHIRKVSAQIIEASG
ncbi:MAG: cytochrome c oxidase assembly protein [Candidatus Methylomirabilales bacterium]